MIARHDMLRAIVLNDVLPDGRQQILPHVPTYKLIVDDLRAILRRSASSIWRLRAPKFPERRARRAIGRCSIFVCRALDDRRSRAAYSDRSADRRRRSFEILFGELFQLYRNPQAALPPLELSFRDYCAALKALEQTALFRKSQRYWTDRLENRCAIAQFPLVKNPAAVERPAFKRRTLRIEAETWKRLPGKGHKIPRYLLRAPCWPRMRSDSPCGAESRLHAESDAFSTPAPSSSSERHYRRLHVREFAGSDNSQPEPLPNGRKRKKKQLWQDLEHRYF